jgi:hypothetical protein
MKDMFRWLLNKSNLEYNFGHGGSHAAGVFRLLNLLSFLTHGLRNIAGEGYKKARASFGRRDEFFGALRYETPQYPHNDWHGLFGLLFIVEDELLGWTPAYLSLFKKWHILEKICGNLQT